jgi:predicted dehydrogenase
MGQLGILSGPCNPRLERAPKSLDWNLWLGPTAEVPYCDFRHSHWWGIAEYSGGMVTNWGSHHLDVALWASGNHLTFPTVVDGNGTIPEIAAGTGLPNDFAVTFQYPNDLVIEMRTTPKDHGILFVGEEGQVFVNRARVSGKPFEDLAANPLPASAQRVNSQRAPGSRQKLAEIQHYRDFFDCMATKATPISDVNSGVCCVTALHLANISIALHRAVHFDPETLAVKDDAEALAMSSRPRRSPFLL